jgi:zinc finger MIZ domain-containing protein
MTPGGPPSIPSQNEILGGSNNSNSPQHQQNLLNSAINIMNSPQSLMNSPQNMINSPQALSSNMQQQSQMNSIPNLTDVDLNFDPAAVIDGEGGNDLNVSW